MALEQPQENNDREQTTEGRQQLSDGRKQKPAKSADPNGSFSKLEQSPECFC